VPSPDLAENANGGSASAFSVGIDIDGVMADFVGAFCAQIRRRYGTVLTRHEVRAHDVSLAIGLTHDETERLIDEILGGPDVRCVPGVHQGMATLAAAGIQVYVVTARFRGEPDAESRVRQWLAATGLIEATHFHRVAALPEGKKHTVRLALDCVVDDNLTELLRYYQHRPDIGHRVVFDQPWNATKDVHHRFHRVHSWDQLTDHLLGLRTEAGTPGHP
jgi:5'(3')-deoxyribonucleotidase